MIPGGDFSFFFFYSITEVDSETPTLKNGLLQSL